MKRFEIDGLLEWVKDSLSERATSEALHYDVVPPEAYTLHRILRGVPEGLDDIPPMQAFPMESNLDVMGGLNFRKGCYVGQELTVRTYHTGVVRKRILPVIIQKPDELGNVTPGTSSPSFPSGLDLRAVVARSPEDGSRVPRPRGNGKLLISIQGVGLALLRLEHIEGAEKGDFRIEFDVTGEDGKATWAVSHWWPDWRMESTNG